MNGKISWIGRALLAAILLAPPALWGGGVVMDCTTSEDFLAVVQGGGTVTFACRSATIIVTNTVEIREDTTIDGEGQNISLSGNDKVRLFIVRPGATLVLLNLTLRQGRAAYGAAVHNQGMLRVTNCVFQSNTAAGANGAAGRAGDDEATDGDNGGDGGDGLHAAGGAIYNDGELRVGRCRFLDNRAVGGNGGNGGNGGDGGIAGGDGGDGGEGAPGWGGAIFNTGGMRLADSTIARNSTSGGNGGTGGTNGAGQVLAMPGAGGTGAPSGGGGVYNQGTVLLVRSTFADNTVQAGHSAKAGVDNRHGVDGPRGGAALGGAICNISSLQIVNCTVSSNSVVAGNGADGGNGEWSAGDGGDGGHGWGGGLFSSGTARIDFCTFSGGSARGGTNGLAGAGGVGGADGQPGGDLGGNLASDNGTDFVATSIFAHPVRGKNGYGTFVDSGYNISSDDSLEFAGTGSMNSTDPRLGPLADNGGPTQTMALRTNSPARNRIEQDLCVAADQRGFLRPYNPLCDVGAYEFSGAPGILQQPENQNVTEGETATFAVQATGVTPLRYRWRFNGTNLGTNVTGATSPTLTITNAGAAQAGNYDVVVTNYLGAVTSQVATLTVTAPAIITRQPSDQMVLAGANAQFSVDAGGTVPLGFEWRFNITNIIGEHVVSGPSNSTLTIPGASANDAGAYDVVVTNSFGAVTSRVAVLTIGTSPSLIIQPTNQTVALGATAVFTAQAAGTPTPHFAWTFNTTNLPNGNIVFTATNSTLTITNADAAKEGTYECVITNRFGAITSAVARLTLLAPPSVTASLSPQTAVQGEEVKLTASATGSQPLSYQWRKDGEVLPGATSSTFVLTAVGPTNAGLYDVVVTNPAGCVTNTCGRLTVLTGPPYIASITLQASNVTLSLQAVAGVNYVLQAAGTPGSPSWEDRGTNQLSTNGVLLLSDPITPESQGQRFYRVRVQR